MLMKLFHVSGGNKLHCQRWPGESLCEVTSSSRLALATRKGKPPCMEAVTQTLYSEYGPKDRTSWSEVEQSHYGIM